jgi:hypothetical protein
MAFVKVINENSIIYPYTVSDLKRDNPTVSFPDNITDETLNYYNIYRVNKVDHGNDPYTIYEQDAPVFINGEWIEKWIESKMNQKQINQVNSAQWIQVRQQRDKLLYESDWTQLADCPLSSEKKQEWADYRQQLRNITNQPNPFSIVWPVKP